MNVKEMAIKIGFIQPQCRSWNEEKKIKKIIRLIAKGVKTHIFEDGNVGIIWGDYLPNKYRELMIPNLALWLNNYQ